jgi:hypothetical protein
LIRFVFNQISIAAVGEADSDASVAATQPGGICSMRL